MWSITGRRGRRRCPGEVSSAVVGCHLDDERQGQDAMEEKRRHCDRALKPIPRYSLTTSGPARSPVSLAARPLVGELPADLPPHFTLSVLVEPSWAAATPAAMNPGILLLSPQIKSSGFVRELRTGRSDLRSIVPQYKRVVCGDRKGRSPRRPISAAASVIRARLHGCNRGSGAGSDGGLDAASGSRGGQRSSHDGGRRMKGLSCDRFCVSKAV